MRTPIPQHRGHSKDHQTPAQLLCARPPRENAFAHPIELRMASAHFLQSPARMLEITRITGFLTINRGDDYNMCMRNFRSHLNLQSRD